MCLLWRLATASVHIHSHIMKCIYLLARFQSVTKYNSNTFYDENYILFQLKSHGQG